MVFLDRRLHKIHLCSSGGSNIILGELVHGLAVQVAEAQFLCPYQAPDPTTVCPVGSGRWKDKHLSGRSHAHPPFTPSTIATIF